MLERWRRVSQTFPRCSLKVCVISLYQNEEFRDSPLFPHVQVLGIFQDLAQTRLLQAFLSLFI